MRSIPSLILVVLCVSALAQDRIASDNNTITFEQLAELTGGQSGADFAYSVAISGGTVVVGAPLATAGCNGALNCGAAYVFSQTNGDWNELTLVATLTETNGMPDGGFGGNIAISGNTIAVAGTDATTEEGAVYVFVEPTGGWQDMTQTAELTVAGAEPFVQIAGVAIDGNTIVVGTPLASVGRNQNQGTAYVYVEPPNGWTNTTQTAQLVASDASSNFHFGSAVGVSGRNVVVGAPAGTSGGVSECGLAYLFVQPSGGWSGFWGQTTEFEASGGTRDAGFGSSVSVSGDTIVVGAPEQAVNANPEQGAAYVFTRPPTGWPKVMNQTGELTASNGTAGNKLGASVSINNQTVLAGAPMSRSRQGISYIFLEPEGGWQNATDTAEITASDGAAENYFGWSTAIGSGVLVVGATGWPDGGLSPDGATYVFGKTGQL